jgi:hypothetical protein
MEVLIALAVITTVMTATTPFLVKSVALVGKQRLQQTAVQLATDGVERVRAIKPDKLFSGRSEQQTTEQWNAAPAKVRSELDKMFMDWDRSAMVLPTAGPRAPLPTAAVPVTLAQATFEQRWYAGRCWQKPIVSAPDGAADCKKDRTSGDAAYVRVVVSVSWKGQGCSAASCVEVTSTLTSVDDDPVLEVNPQPPVIIGPGSAFAYVDEEVDANDGVKLQMLSEGGAPGPLTWSIEPASAAPPGLSITASGVFTGAPTTAGPVKVPVKVTDTAGDSDTASLDLIVYPQLTITSIANQNSAVGAVRSLSVPAAGGMMPRTWAADNLPPGLSINPADGFISGTTTTAVAKDVMVTVTDANGRTASTNFLWIVGTPPPGPLTANRKAPITAALKKSLTGVTMTALGGTPAYTWTAKDLPPGLVINSATGAVTGTPSTCTRYVSTMTVTDKVGAKASTQVVWQMSKCGSAKVTAPSPTNPDQSTVLGAVVNLTAKTTLSGSSLKWTATGLPSGLTMAVDGAVTGSPSMRGTYPVKFTVTSGTTTAALMFTWTVT